MPTNETEPKAKKVYESGHAKILESWGKLIAIEETLDPVKLDAPPDLTDAALKAAQTTAGDLQSGVGNSRADWRTIALDRATDILKFAPRAAQAVGLLEGHGASRETVSDARSYVRKLQGRRAAPRAADNPATPNINESEKGVSASQQSSAAEISTMYELIDFLEAQSAYTGVKAAGMTAGDLRQFVDATQAKHALSITAAATLAAARRERDKFYYDNPDSLCTLAARFKALVKGAYGAGSAEYKAVNAVKFKRPQ